MWLIDWFGLEEHPSTNPSLLIGFKRGCSNGGERNRNGMDKRRRVISIDVGVI
jgi:hypothetical protein